MRKNPVVAISVTPEVHQFCQKLKRDGKLSPQLTEIIQASRQFKKWLQTRR